MLSSVVPSEGVKKGRAFWGRDGLESELTWLVGRVQCVSHEGQKSTQESGARGEEDNKTQKGGGNGSQAGRAESGLSRGSGRCCGRTSARGRGECNIGTGTLAETVLNQDFGVFVIFQAGKKKLKGLCHISEVADEYIKDIHQYMHKGDSVQAVVTKLDPKTRNVSLSIKAARQMRGEAKEARTVEK